jgi:hypothetical protein
MVPSSRPEPCRSPPVRCRCPHPHSTLRVVEADCLPKPTGALSAFESSGDDPSLLDRSRMEAEGEGEDSPACSVAAPSPITPAIKPITTTRATTDLQYSQTHPVYTTIAHGGKRDRAEETASTDRRAPSRPVDCISLLMLSVGELARQHVAVETRCIFSQVAKEHMSGERSVALLLSSFTLCRSFQAAASCLGLKHKQACAVHKAGGWKRPEPKPLPMS